MNGNSFAEEVEELDTINVISITNDKMGETRKTATELKKQQVQDSRDLVRYETGVTVVEAGRFGASGYAIRGVDENRVAINIDGLRQAETLANQGFKELFEGYGNFNNTRNSVEIETLKEAVIRKGADSVASGNGALGGAVAFETKDARDFLIEKDWYLGYRTGYSTADKQRLNSVTAAGRYKWFDALVVVTGRNGHETENYGYTGYNAFKQGKEREKADPYKIEANSLLAKFSVSPNENHRFTITSDKSERTSRGHDFSYNLKPQDYINLAEDDLRHTNDATTRKFFSISYENTASNLFWDTAKISFSNQKITTKARTDDYCDGNEKCEQYKNPYGLQLKDGKIVDREGNTPKVEVREVDKGGWNEHTAALVDSNGNVVTSDGIDARAREFWFDCSIFDCNAPVSTWSKSGWGSGTQVTNKELNLDEQYIDPRTGKRYATSSSFGYSDYIVIPRSSGYSENLYTDRDLNTKTKQLNLDLTKSAVILSKENNFTYGFSYSETEKSMVNRTGYNGINPVWWANTFLGVDANNVPYTSCENARKDTSWQARKNDRSSLVCPTVDTYSFLIPVKTKDKSLYLTDNIQLHDRFSLDLGFRYNSTKYQPNYVAGQTAKIPDDMVKGLFIPLPANNVGNEPKWWDDAYNGFSDPKYNQDLQAYRERKAAYDAAVANNPAENIAYFSKPKKFSEKSYSLAGTFDATDNIRLQAKYAKGFRMPTTDEMYFTFQHPDITVLPNVDLSPETAKTKELAVTLHGELGFITGGVFRTDYKDFIDFAFVGNKDLGALTGKPGATVSSRKYPLYKSINREIAQVQGFEINTNLNVGYLYSRLQGLNIGYKLTRQKGRTGEGIPMNAIQPMTSVFNLGYDAPSQKFGFDLYISHVSSKKAEDTNNMFYEEELNGGNADATPYLKWRSDSYTVVDFTTYIKPIKNLTLQFGVYNLTNRKYMTWDSARSIRSFGTSNMINKTTGEGINRFYSPGRNYKLNAEITF
ncbi:TonB-dependent hemoglobin/transferrin/lactoferrin family receptor [Mannheimia sp. AT1]|uniref:TonB-dependent hemoglobin/transferrin/lactoferrin family receptor n=2 Tax=Mannheimia cairinae TaxID=3025936 RepID=A0ABT5MN38_9PAST|nr:TonB-dependent hemoglobin/transferrin/lactoferrin family receptor [Mannheimia cairinae]MDD0823589.1 TonB-dependent hemoglobin/transferrin/lactoferrin family receptor [Mannheimia cairinae]